MNKLPNPGSKEAQKAGCICAVIDNHYGKGRPDGTFWITEGCPLHDIPRTPNLRFHSPKRGCTFKVHKRPSKYNNGKIDIHFCLKHNVDTCRCGWEFLYHYSNEGDARGKRIEYHSPRGEVLFYKLAWIKDRCVACNNRIIPSLTNYDKRGNYCQQCSGKAQRNIIWHRRTRTLAQVFATASSSNQTTPVLQP